MITVTYNTYYRPQLGSDIRHSDYKWKTSEVILKLSLELSLLKTEAKDALYRWREPWIHSGDSLNHGRWNAFTSRWISFQPKAIVTSMILLGHCWVNNNWSLFMNSVLLVNFAVRVLLWIVTGFAKVVLSWSKLQKLFWSVWELIWRCINRCPNCKHRKDLENPGMGQKGHDCRKLRKRQESSFLLTLVVQIGGVAVGQDPWVLC